MGNRVLLLHASGGTGHVKAAEALATAFRLAAPQVEVRNINTLDFANRTFRFCYERGYEFISSHAIGIWGWLYRRYNDPQRHGLLVRLTRWAILAKLRAFLDSFQPHVIVGTHPLAIRLLTAAPWPSPAAPVPTAMVVTDFGCHSYWVDPAISRYYVAVDDVRACILGYGVPPERVVVSGIPIDPKFSQPHDRRSLAPRFGLKPDLPTVLVVGGLLSERYLREFLTVCTREGPAQCVIATGRDHRLRRQLVSSPLRRLPWVKVYGFVTNIEELLAVADVAVTKAGGLTVSECLGKGVPLAIPRVIPGQEDDNLDFLVRHGVALRSSSATAMAHAVNRWLRHPRELARVKQRCRALGKPHAAAAVVADVVRYAEQRRRAGEEIRTSVSP